MIDVQINEVPLKEHSPSMDNCLDEQKLLYDMLLSREFDNRSAIVTRQGRAWFHVSAAGHEGLAVLPQLMEKNDVLVPYYRDRALVLARGMSIVEMTRELMGKGTSHSAGRTMSNHFCSKEHNIFSVVSLTGTQCIPATGAAWASVLDNKNGLVVCGVGDAATRQGEFYEAVSFAVERRLPVVFVVSDNKLGISTSTEKMAPYRLGIFNECLIRRVDARKPETLFPVAQEVFNKARFERTPCILVCRMDRLDSHSNSDSHKLYRTPDELETLQDPIENYIAYLKEKGAITEQALAEQKERIKADVAEIFERVYHEEEPDPASVSTYLCNREEKPTVHVEMEAEETQFKAVNQVLDEALSQDPKVLIFGEDIEDPKGGVFGFTRGLSTRYPERVFNAPLSEATIIGSSVGLSACGWRPIVELQFIDFVGLGLNQLQSQLGTLSWRTVGKWRCPVVIYAPYGAYLPGGGIWHSQSSDGILAHIPGINVMVPTTPADTVALFRTALSLDMPSLILIPKHLMRERHERRLVSPVSLGQANIVRAGKDITLVAWGNTIQLATMAALQAEKDNIDIEVIELRSLVPWDKQRIAESLRKTGRLIVVQEDTRTASVGASIIADILDENDNFFSLLAPPRLVTREDIHIPFNPCLEKAVLPGTDDILASVYAVMS
ncbi:dehydrogenase E1 component subunit alpha/beta [Photorhabdus caribbeanensis]|uniref:dehydrogenase E1 component subunit alpha/beta n=1 Tax=Photorhabdus caribbeanensis TaxID=1004165 RepID=UPI001BD2B43D|nr:branched-chain alpha-keto acid dehydrogenase [Photorhabdus caribbeanensis]